MGPSFGRHGGPNSPEFGEFDFILITDQAVYLGESKWHRSSEDIVNGKLHLRPEQLERHEIMEWYISEWLEEDFKDWKDFFIKKGGKISKGNLMKPLPPPGSLLSENLSKLLGEIKVNLKADLCESTMCSYTFIVVRRCRNYPKNPTVTSQLLIWTIQLSE